MSKINGYVLSRAWFDYAFENPELVTVHQTAIFMWLIECNNRKGFSEKFAFNTDDCKSTTGIKDRKTIWHALALLESAGFVEIIFKAKNQNQVSVLSIQNCKATSNKCLDKKLIETTIRSYLESPSEQTALPPATPPPPPLAVPPTPPPSLKQINNKQRNNKFIEPSLEEVKNYFNENGYTLEAGEKAYNYYDTSQWHDSNNKPVKNWKQKMQGVWFKEENKKKNNQQPLLQFMPEKNNEW